MGNFKKKWSPLEITPAVASRINSDVLMWLVTATKQAKRTLVGVGATPAWGFTPDAARFPKWKLGEMLRARWALKKEVKEGRLPKGYVIASEAAMAALVAMRDCPRGLPLLVAGGRALAIADVVPMGGGVGAA
jgi:hypothetical protein